MNVKSKFVIVLMIGLLCSLTRPVKAQLCNGSLGDPVVLIDFGRGSGYIGPPIGDKTNYTYVAAELVHDGFYTIEQLTTGGSWHAIRNHTPNDPSGYFMMINASYTPGIFYQTDIPVDLCPNTTYEFACWVINLLKGKGIRPNLSFQILDMDDKILHTFSTGDIVETANPTWTQYGSLFNTGLGNTRVKIKIINNAPGGGGNDLAIDDITFRPCGPTVVLAIDNMANQTEKTVCDNETKTFNITSSVEESNALKYLWQKKDGTIWTDLGSETSPQININPSSLAPGIYEYRLIVATPSNINSLACRTASSPVTITVKASPQLILPPEYSICQGQNLQLALTGTDGTYEWSGPNNFSSNLKSPTISNAAPYDNGIYQVVVTANGCTKVTQTNVTVHPLPIASVVESEFYLCYGASNLLMASGGTTYKWSPAIGLSDPDIANPIASPTRTTTYEVTVSNGFCEDKTQVKVNVYRKTLANAGNNKVIMEGESTTLDGSISGDSLQYFWSPSTDLDDPRKLNPKATPLVTTTYTLNATSLLNCKGATSSMIVKVFKKVIVPNTFTPNDDGINDLWNIEALQAYPNAEIRVLNRYGEKVFGVKGNFQNWDGRYKGKPLPAGTYFYWIDLHEAGQKPIVGPINILR